jgi:hypothetical protein
MRKIKFDRMAPTMQKSIDETIPEEHSTIALGATTFESVECNINLECWTRTRQKVIIKLF